MCDYGLIGFPLGHSLSKKYFEEKFLREDIPARFYNFEIENLKCFSRILEENSNLKGLSVTIPYKEKIIPYLDDLDEAARSIGAVNCIKISIKGGRLITKGYNTDYMGFGESLDIFLNNVFPQALVLGTGGACKAVVYALEQRQISYKVVSRNPSVGQFSYDDLHRNIVDYQLIINTTPLGTYPETNSYPDIPYQLLGEKHLLYDLVYNPEETEFLRKGRLQGAKICNGLPMLISQAEAAWGIWNS